MFSLAQVRSEIFVMLLSGVIGSYCAAITLQLFGLVNFTDIAATKALHNYVVLATAIYAASDLCADYVPRLCRRLMR